MSRFYLASPIRLHRAGSPSGATRGDHVRQMLELLLLTTPGERPHRPEFGCGLLDRVFDGLSPEVALEVSTLVRHSVERWFSIRIRVISVDVRAVSESIEVIIAYALLPNLERRQDVFCL